MGMQKASIVRQQLHAIGNNLSSFLSTATALNDAASGNAVLAYAPPKISVPGESNLRQCTIEISGGNLTLSYDIVDLQTGATETVAQSVQFKNPSGAGGFTISPPLSAAEPGKCGESIKLTKS